jgi:hypothetical protein
MTPNLMNRFNRESSRLDGLDAPEDVVTQVLNDRLHKPLVAPEVPLPVSNNLPRPLTPGTIRGILLVVLVTAWSWAGAAAIAQSQDAPQDCGSIRACITQTVLVVCGNGLVPPRFTDLRIRVNEVGTTWFREYRTVAISQTGRTHEYEGTLLDLDTAKRYVTRVIDVRQPLSDWSPELTPPAEITAIVTLDCRTLLAPLVLGR